MPVINPDTALTKVGSNLSFLKDWSHSNEETFVHVMHLLEDEKPDRWAELYLKVQDKISEPKVQTKTTNINVHVDKDFDKLKALSSTVDPIMIPEPTK